MSQQVINIGTLPGDGSGDPLRVSFNKINQNFAELYAAMSILSLSVNTINTKIGSIVSTATGIDNGTLGPLISDYGFIIDPVTAIIDYGSI